MITIGSPLASAVSGPGVAEINAICLLSGDHVTSAPVPGSGAFVPLASVKNVAADKRINGFFAHTDIPSFKQKLTDFICVGTGGPCYYGGRDMKTAHAGMGVRGRDFNALVQDLGATLKKFKVPHHEQMELVAILGPMKMDIVTR